MKDFNIYVINIIIERRVDESGNVVNNGRVLNKYPLCANFHGELKDYTLFKNAIWKEYIHQLKDDELSRASLYIRKFDGKKWQNELVSISEFMN